MLYISELKELDSLGFSTASCRLNMKWLIGGGGEDGKLPSI